MLTEKFSHNGASVEVRRADVRARLRAQLVYATFDVQTDMPDEAWAELRFFARFLSQTRIEGDLGFPVAAVSDDRASLERCLEAFLAADEVLYDRLLIAMNNVARNPGDADLLPEDELDAKKKTTPPSGSDETSS